MNDTKEKNVVENRYGVNSLGIKLEGKIFFKGVNEFNYWFWLVAEKEGLLTGWHQEQDKDGC